MERTEKKFNTAGPSRVGDHYMVDPLHRIDYGEISNLIDDKRYFALHAPRQTGKTTSLLAMVKRINEEDYYRCVYMNVEAAQTARNDVAAGMKAIIAADGSIDMEKLLTSFQQFFRENSEIWL